ncbi:MULTISPECIES: MpaA1 family daptide-type RiPP [unclassified Rathayibacter]|nr:MULTISPECIES: MpaA1 family daptide-type RiPP [unclassified Rathayibacter]MBF4461832.1 hypothetical protein [Rathayibacter sp. VKM Ac-2879]MBF4503245.1 hypothetical protein [Rathayibacter sp. VKM Ac-2878]
MDTNRVSSGAALAFVELDPLDAPSEDSYWQGMVAGVGVLGIVAIVAT